VGRRQRLDPFVPTPRDIVGRILDFAEIDEGAVLVDLGSGDGRIVVEAARRGSARAIGVEIDPALVEYSLETVRRLRLRTATFTNDDIRRVDLTGATHVTAYLTSKALRAIEPVLLKARRDAIVVTHDYPILGWAPVETLTTWSSSDGRRHTLYKYVPMYSAPKLHQILRV